MTEFADADAVEAYYRDVDAEEYEAVFDLFAEDVTYTRSGPRVIQGLQEFRDFYVHDRALRGEHTIDRMVVDGDVVAVQGRFEGTKLTDGSEASFGFADFLRFDPDGLITERATYNNMLDEPL
jgi:ketosteroid isomerase-like protein